MKTVLLAGGLGTRLSELSNLCPKPMVEIGGMSVRTVERAVADLKSK
jgi:glucose-1-phosphate cytidylyltransferase